MKLDPKLKAAFAQVNQQQQTLIAEIFSQDGQSTLFDQRGMEIYRRNLRATAQQVLAISFPTVFELIGETLFNYACGELLQSSPPCEGDWGLWGEDFADSLASMPALEEYPFVADIATLDFIIHQSQRAKDTQLDQESIQLLSNTELDNLQLVLSESCYLMSSDYPVIEFRQAHLQINDEEGVLAKQQLEIAEQKLFQPNFKQYVLVYRTEFKAQLMDLEAEEFTWLTLLLRGETVGKALDEMSESRFDFAQWLGKAIENNLVHFFNEKEHVKTGHK